MHDALPWLLVCLSAVAFLYSSVGHAGASGYIAVMTLFGLSLEVVRPTALTLNILVATVTSYQFARAGHLRFALFWPFALLSVPLAFVGGYISLPTAVLKRLVGAVLLFSAARLLLRPPPEGEVREPPRGVAIAMGGGLGLLSGLTGTGGGIFLTPLLLLLGWARAKQASAVSALFILVNSIAGLLGNLGKAKGLPSDVPWFALAALSGGLLGSYLCAARLSPAAIKRLLALVLVIAGAKLML